MKYIEIERYFEVDKKNLKIKKNTKEKNELPSG